ncbi:MAG: IS66 family transposase, partial [Lachnospiraceae bacterium]|nr:IS66 family transposase [Lachnospiraceae bacterium]
MKAETDAFRNRIKDFSFDKLVELTVSGYEKYRDLKMRDEENQRISTEIHIRYSIMAEENRKLKEENASLKDLLRKEIEKNELKTRSTFGRSTEKLLSLIDSAANKAGDFEDEDQEEDITEKEGRIVSFPGGGNKADNAGNDGGRKKEKANTSGNKGSGKTGLKRSIENLPREILYLLDAAALNAAYGEGNWRIAFWREHISVEKMPVSYYARYILTPVISSGLEHELYTVPYYNLLLPHTYASFSIMADILYRKFMLSLPFHRQAVDYQMSGLDLSKQVIIHWVNAIVPEFFERVRSYMTEYLIRSGYIQSDESYFLVNKDGRGAGHKSFMWVHCTSEMLDSHPVIVFYYEATRGTDHLRQLFGEFLGYIICDAYISYQVMEKENPLITVAGCFMHCRRYFAEALFVNDISSMTDDEIRELSETKALLLIREIYIAENALRDVSPDERLRERQISV